MTTAVLDVTSAPARRFEQAAGLGFMILARLVLCVVIILHVSTYREPATIDLQLPRLVIGLLLCIPLFIAALAAAAVRFRGRMHLIQRLNQLGLAMDTFTCWGLVWTFNPDHSSNMWALLAVAAIEGAFHADIRGSLGIFAASATFYVARDWTATDGHIDVASCTYRLATVGCVALLSGLLARQRRSVLREVEARDRDLITIARVSRALAVAPEARLAVAEGVREIMGAATVLIMEPDVTDENLVTTAHTGQGDGAFSLPLDPGWRYENQRSRAAQAFLRGEPLFVPDVTKISGLNQEVLASYRTRSMWLVPIRGPERSIGLVGVGFEQVMARPPERMTDAMKVLIDDAAIAIARADTEAQLGDAARTDPLTGLLNRRGWADQLDREMARTRRTGKPLCLMLIDLDHFKAYNDTYGHAAGDALLQQLSLAWRNNARTTDLVARLGGDEFAVAMPDLSETDAEARLQRLLDVVPQGSVGASAGLTIWQPGESVEVAMHRADTALYEAKAAGRGQVVLSRAI